MVYGWSEPVLILHGDQEENGVCRVQGQLPDDRGEKEGVCAVLAKLNH